MATSSNTGAAESTQQVSNTDTQRTRWQRNVQSLERCVRRKSHRAEDLCSGDGLPSIHDGNHRLLACPAAYIRRWSLRHAYAQRLSQRHACIPQVARREAPRLGTRCLPICCQEIVHGCQLMWCTAKWCTGCTYKHDNDKTIHAYLYALQASKNVLAVHLRLHGRKQKVTR